MPMQSQENSFWKFHSAKQIVIISAQMETKLIRSNDRQNKDEGKGRKKI